MRLTQTSVLIFYFLLTVVKDGWYVKILIKNLGAGALCNHQARVELDKSNFYVTQFVMGFSADVTQALTALHFLTGVAVGVISLHSTLSP